MQMQDLNFATIDVGTRVTFRKTFYEADLIAFSQLSGDYNPLHIDPVYAEQTPFGQRVVYGMLVAALFSRLVGMYLPGRQCLYLAQTLDFVAPVFLDQELEVIGEVQSRHELTRTLVLKTEIYVPPTQLVVRGKAHVKVRE